MPVCVCVCHCVCVCVQQEVTWGVAYQVLGEQHVRQALDQLNVRESSQGGYHSMLTTFYPRHPGSTASTTSSDDDNDNDNDSDNDSANDNDNDNDNDSDNDDANDSDNDNDNDDDNDNEDDNDNDTDNDSDNDNDNDSDQEDGDVTVTSEPFPVLSFTAPASSRLYLGPADVSAMARQVVAARGQAGPNSEYVLRTAEYVRRHIPEDQDRHLFELERVVREVISVRRAAAAASAS